MADKAGVVNIRGKEYKTVALRIDEFRKAHKDMSCTTEILIANESMVMIKATIFNGEGKAVATGHAEEMRSANMINRTSALENAETSAIGRALACFGFGGSEFASANEVEGAIAAQKTPATPEQKAQIQAFMMAGQITSDHLTKAFGHSDLNALLEVEATRILAAFSQPAPQQQIPEEKV
jgi:hypothetical protein